MKKLAIFLTVLSALALTACQEAPEKADQTSQAPTDQTADWKTYTNSSFAYSIKYPSDWHVTEITKEGENDYQLQTICISESKELDVTSFCTPSVGVNKTTVEEKIKDLTMVSGLTSREEVTLAEHKATLISYNSEMDDRPLITIMIPLNGYVYSLTYGTEARDNPTVSKILDTFAVSEIAQKTETITSTDAWKKIVQYNCMQSGGSFKNDKCECPIEEQLSQTSESMYDKSTGYCTTTVGGPGGEVGLAAEQCYGYKLDLDECKKK